MSLQEFVQSIVDRFHATGNVKTVFGEPIESKGRTIIPVAKVAYAFAAGASGSAKSASEDGGRGQSIGGGIVVRPAGVLEIRDDATEFIPFAKNKKLLGALFLGLLVGAWLAGRPRKS